MQRRIRRYGAQGNLSNVAGRTAILVDDGLATGLTALAAIAALRKARPEQIVLAVPVSSPEAADAVTPYVDHGVCLATSPDFMAVGTWYASFETVTDEEVVALLERARAQQPSKMTLNSSRR